MTSTNYPYFLHYFCLLPLPISCPAISCLGFWQNRQGWPGSSRIPRIPKWGAICCEVFSGNDRGWWPSKPDFLALVHPAEVISTAKPSEIGVICTNLAIPNWSTTFRGWSCLVQNTIRFQQTWLAGNNPTLLGDVGSVLLGSHRPKCSMFCNSTGTFPFLGGLNHQPICQWLLFLVAQPHFYTALDLRLVVKILVASQIVVGQTSILGETSVNFLCSLRRVAGNGLGMGVAGMIDSWPLWIIPENSLGLVVN